MHVCLDIYRLPKKYICSSYKVFSLDCHHISHVIETSPSDVLEIFISCITSTTPISFELKLLVNIILVAFIIATYTSISHDIASCEYFTSHFDIISLSNSHVIALKLASIYTKI